MRLNPIDPPLQTSHGFDPADYGVTSAGQGSTGSGLTGSDGSGSGADNSSDGATPYWATGNGPISRLQVVLNPLGPLAPYTDPDTILNGAGYQGSLTNPVGSPGGFDWMQGWNGSGGQFGQGGQGGFGGSFGGGQNSLAQPSSQPNFWGAQNNGGAGMNLPGLSPSDYQFLVSLLPGSTGQMSGAGGGSGGTSGNTGNDTGTGGQWDTSLPSQVRMPYDPTARSPIEYERQVKAQQRQRLYETWQLQPSDAICLAMAYDAITPKDPVIAPLTVLGTCAIAPRVLNSLPNLGGFSSDSDTPNENLPPDRLD